jgi:hypothetical protein
MSESTEQTTKPKKQPSDKTPIGRMTIAEVDAAITDCDRIITTNSATMKIKLAGNAAIPPAVLRDLSRANSQRGRLVMRRISQLLELGEPAAMDLIDKLLKVQPSTN